LQTLSSQLERFADFLGIDSDLIAAAAEQSEDVSKPGVSRSEITGWVRNLSPDERDSLLMRLIEDDIPYPETPLRQRVLCEMQAKRPACGNSDQRRTVAQILASADAIMRNRQRIETERAEQEQKSRERRQAEQRRRHLESLRGREDDLWAKADQLIVTKQPRKYDEAVSILQDLRDLAEKDQASSAFHQRMKSLSRDHANKPTLLRRIEKAGLSVIRQFLNLQGNRSEWTVKR
jgi:hypothetical protein